MKFTNRVMLATAATAVMTASAFAADLYVPIEEPFIPATSTLGWTGAYVGVHAGYGWGEFDMDDGDIAEVDGWLAGVQAGYNVNLDGIVLGVEGDIAWADINGSVDLDDEFELVGTIDWLGTIRGRVGFAADAFLIYGTAGVAFAGGDMLFLDEGEDDGSDSATHVGWVVGAGVETMVTDTISLKAEYLYHSFGGETYFEDDGDYEGLFDVSTVKVGLNFHF